MDGDGDWMDGAMRPPPLTYSPPPSPAPRSQSAAPSPCVRRTPGTHTTQAGPRVACGQGRGRGRVIDTEILLENKEGHTALAVATASPWQENPAVKFLQRMRTFRDPPTSYVMLTTSRFAGIRYQTRASSGFNFPQSTRRVVARVCANWGALGTSKINLTVG